MRLQHLLRPLLVLLFAGLLGGCGFTLRGDADLPSELQTLTLNTPNPNNELSRELRRALVSNKVILVDGSEAGHYHLGVGGESSRERVLSVNANARAGEYELILEAPVQLSRDGQLAFGPEVFSVSRVYLADPENAVAKNEEAQLIRAELRRELAQQILRRLQALDLQ